MKRDSDTKYSSEHNTHRIDNPELNPNYKHNLNRNPNRENKLVIRYVVLAIGLLST